MAVASKMRQVSTGFPKAVAMVIKPLSLWD
jgi:hypothetical protein